MDKKQCNYCGGRDLEIAAVHDPMRTPVKQKHVQCEECGAWGPLAGTDELAIQKWNNRIQETPEMPQERPTIVEEWDANNRYFCPLIAGACNGAECMMWVWVGDSDKGRCGLVNTMYINSTVW